MNHTKHKRVDSVYVHKTEEFTFGDGFYVGKQQCVNKRFNKQTVTTTEKKIVINNKKQLKESIRMGDEKKNIFIPN